MVVFVFCVDLEVIGGVFQRFFFIFFIGCLVSIRRFINIQYNQYFGFFQFFCRILLVLNVKEVRFVLQFLYKMKGVRIEKSYVEICFVQFVVMVRLCVWGVVFKNQSVVVIIWQKVVFCFFLVNNRFGGGVGCYFVFFFCSLFFCEYGLCGVFFIVDIMRGDIFLSCVLRFIKNGN